MALKVENLPRVFKFSSESDDNKTLTDPNPSLSPTEVMDFYAGQHPELTTAKISGPIIEDGKAVYSFVTNYGTKA
ncbi:MAG: PRTRC system protein C [Cytophagales bacterium]|nr:PRTRC system protein C [Cytophagales bacterium]